MEPQTRYDLNAAVESWRQELAAQPGLTEEARRELETHLLDAIAGFQRTGLNDEESFWLARRRVGQPQQLVEEFVKVDPTAVWRERVFWMAVALLFDSFWFGAIMSIPFGLWVRESSWQWVSCARMLLQYIPPVWLAIILARGTAGERWAQLAAVFASRRRLAYCATGLLLVTRGYLVLANIRHLLDRRHGGTPSSAVSWVSVFSLICWPLVLVALTVWLMPSDEARRRDRVRASET